MIACYDLATKPCSFDFLTFLCIVRTHGAEHIRFGFNGNFKPKDYDNPKQRFDSIMAPACEMVGIPYSVGPKEGREFSHFIGELISTYKKLGKISKYGKPNPGNYVTVTLRNSRKEYRNSSPDWLKFAGEIDALVIPDYEDTKIGLEDRLRIYENARLNMFVNNGPAMLCIASDMPYAILKYANKGGATNDEWLASQGLPRDSQYPFASAHQRIFWGSDTYQEIWSAYEEMNERLGKPA